MLASTLRMLLYGEDTMLSNARLNSRSASEFMHMQLKCKGLLMDAVKRVIGCLP